MSFIIKSSCGCHIGKVRFNNEDNFYYNNRHLAIHNTALKKALFHVDKTDEVICYAVFDGMGGEKHGEVASFIAASEMKETIRLLDDLVIPPKQFLVEACLKMNERICTEAQSKKYKRMGSTAAILYFHLQDVYMCNIGDSRVLRIRDGSMIQVSVDHNDAVYINADGSIVREARKAALTQFLGIPPEEMLIDPYIAKDVCKSGDRFIVCSDGLTDMLTNDEILHIIVSNKENQQECVQRLINAALDNGGLDNITVILCDVI